MGDTTILLLAVAGLLFVGALVYIFRDYRKKGGKTEEKENPALQLQLQAYERLTLLVDRIALPNLISRVNQAGLSAREMQLVLTKNIKDEYEYNITQQIYVSADAWTAVKNLKEQNMLVVNQFANALPPKATGLDLNKLLLEFLMNDKKGSLHEVVSEVLSYEAKRLFA
ncbi:DUF7935 family protein [Foetidibacter luteolus]|uniref:DUF7935 family protein n=1 Tax=Foetidibacter luteolus TaxID=2608880 RepID=UPI00129A74F2|nr:hypothetical protein [Foetidibacter luteolus]